MRYFFTIGIKVFFLVFLMLLVHGVQAKASDAPIYYENFASVGSGPNYPSPAANSKGEYFVLYPGVCSQYQGYKAYIAKYDNDFNAIKSWSISCPRCVLCSWDKQWKFTEITIDQSDNVWVSGYMGWWGQKNFIKFDSEGNYLGYIIVRDGKILHSAVDRQFVFDQSDNLYFISYTYDGANAAATLYKIDAQTGAIIKEWSVPSGKHNVHSGMAINSKGELFWGSWEDSGIYTFNPQTEQSGFFADAGDVAGLSMDAKDNLYAVTYGSGGDVRGYILMFDDGGNYIGAKGLRYDKLCDDFHGFGITTFLDEIVVTGKLHNPSNSGVIVKYTSDIENSKEYLYPCYSPPDTVPPTTTLTLEGTIGTNNWYVSNTQVTLTAMDNEGGSGVKIIEYSVDGTTWTTYTSPLTISNEGVTDIYYRSRDNAGNVETTKSGYIRIDKTVPIISTLTVTPGILWPPNHKMVDVRIDGLVTEETSGIASIVITVTDEYGIYHITVPNFGSTIQLEAWRDGTDKDGRVYTITAVATDTAGNQSTATTEVIVPHDMGE